MDKFKAALLELASKAKQIATNAYLSGAPIRHFYDHEHISALNRQLEGTPYRIEKDRGAGEGLTPGYWVTKERTDAVKYPVARFILNTADDIFRTTDYEALDDWLKRNLSKELGWKEPEKTISPEALAKALSVKQMPKAMVNQREQEI